MGCIEIIYHYILIFGYVFKETSVKLLIFPHLKYVNNLSNVTAGTFYYFILSIFINL